MIDGLDKAVATMKKGETALLTIAPEYAFGSSESQQELAVVPPNSTVYYEVELVAFDKVCTLLCKCRNSTFTFIFHVLSYHYSPFVRRRNRGI